LGEIYSIPENPNYDEILKKRLHKKYFGISQKEIDASRKKVLDSYAGFLDLNH